MVSVTQRIKEVKQPRGGYIRPRDFFVTSFEDHDILHTEENIHAGLIGIAVDYLTRYMVGVSAESAFDISLLGASILGKSQSKKADLLLSQITGLNDRSIINACKLAGYDVCYRAGTDFFKPIQAIEPDEATISNIKIMVERSIAFLNEYGPITKEGFTFEGGYTQTINVGDGDFLTKNTLWDLKVSKNNPKTQHTLQLLVYYILGMKSIHKEFKQVEYLGIFNPRLHKMYTLPLIQIEKNVFDEVSKKVIGYI